MGLVGSCERMDGLSCHRNEISGCCGVRLGVSKGGGQVDDCSAGVDGIADMRQGPAESGATARKYVVCLLEPAPSWPSALTTEMYAGYTLGALGILLTCGLLKDLEIFYKLVFQLEC